eukprot:3290774-Rhodomonas_salina.3
MRVCLRKRESGRGRGRGIGREGGREREKGRGRRSADLSSSVRHFSLKSSRRFVMSSASGDRSGVLATLHAPQTSLLAQRRERGLDR